MHDERRLAEAPAGREAARLRVFASNLVLHEPGLDTILTTKISGVAGNGIVLLENVLADF